MVRQLVDISPLLSVAKPPRQSFGRFAICESPYGQKGLAKRVKPPKKRIDTIVIHRLITLESIRKREMTAMLLVLVINVRVCAASHHHYSHGCLTFDAFERLLDGFPKYRIDCLLACRLVEL